MIQRVFKKSFLDEVWTALTVLVLSSAVGLWIFRDGPRAIFHHTIPLGGDGALTGLYLKVANDRPFLSTLFNPLVHSDKFGWPGQLNFSGYPLGQASDLVLLRVVRRLTGVGDVGTLVHIVSVLKVVPIALAVLLLTRIMKLPRFLSIVVSIAYSISTFNLVRSEGHFWLALTWSIPLGLTAIYLAYQTSVHTEKGVKGQRSWKHYLSIFALLLPVAFSGFYYILFFGILSFAIILPVIFSEIWGRRRTQKKLESANLFKAVWSRISSLVYVGLILVVGLLYQTLPVLIDAGKSLTLTGIADRSPIESIVYSGTIESFFYDSSSLFLRLIKRQDLLNFLSGRISWEGSQLGATAGVAAYVGIIVLSLAIARRFFVDSTPWKSPKVLLEDARLQFVIYLLVFAFFLYISSPFNFAISRVLPEIRAWGRMSVVLTLLILLLLSLLISKIWNKRIVAGGLTLLLLVIPLTEAGLFRRDRPASADLSNVAQKAFGLRENSLIAMKNLYAKGCPIFMAPAYPFPEFDRPDDSNIDYTELDLPLRDTGYFRWSYPAVKDTSDWSVFEPLVSEQPPFPRASIQYQLSYAHTLGACGAVIDRTLLTPDEQIQVNALSTKTSKNCFINLPGETFQGMQRFSTVDFKSRGCNTVVPVSISNYAKKNMNRDFLWRIDQPNGLKYIDKWQVFSNISPIAFRQIRSSKAEGKSPVYSFIFTGVKGSAPLTSVKVCLRKISDVVPACANVALDKYGQGSLVGAASQLTTSLQKYEFTIAPESVGKIENWGLVVGI